jgi:hypothetical protein
MLQDACETTRRYVKGLKTKQWFLRIGTQYYSDILDPGMEGRAPRVANIRSLRKEFKNSISELASAQQPTEAPNLPVEVTPT